MAYADYTVTLASGETWTLRMDAAQASAPIKHVDDDGEEWPTQYQTADARHEPRAAAEMLQDGWDRDDEVVAVD